MNKSIDYEKTVFPKLVAACHGDDTAAKITWENGQHVVFWNNARELRLSVRGPINVGIEQ